MRWSKRDSKLFIGPVNDSEIDSLMSSPVLKGSGLACRAANGKVEVYLTVPLKDASKALLIKNLLNIRYGRIGASA